MWILWLAGVSGTIMTVVISASARYNPARLVCQPGAWDIPSYRKFILSAMWLFGIILPLIIMTASNLYIFCITQRHANERHRSNMKAMRMLLMVTWTFVLCNIPSVLLIILAIRDYPLTLQNVLIMTQLYYVNLFVNPLIYSFSSPYCKSTVLAYISGVCGAWGVAVSILSTQQPSNEGIVLAQGVPGVVVPEDVVQMPAVMSFSAPTRIDSA